MKILILGATGFIGKNIFNSLINQHHVIAASRKPIAGLKDWRHIDFSQENNWKELLAGVDVVINAVGIVEGDFKQVQTKTPCDLYANCREMDVKIIHISAIGADKESPSTEFLSSKKITDDFLLENDNARIIYPGIVIGADGESSKFFKEMAQFPIVPITDTKEVPLTHISQLVELINEMLIDFERFPKRVFAIAEYESIKKLVNSIKGKSVTFITVPNVLIISLFRIFPKLSVGIFNKQMFQLLNEINPKDYKPMFGSACDRVEASSIKPSDYFAPLIALLAISFIWFWSGISSLISWEESLEITNGLGASQELSILLVWTGSVVDIILAFAIFSKRYRRKVLIIQVVVMLGYMLILSVFAPAYWLHPFGVLAKNIPLLALSYYLYWKSK